MEDGIYSVNKLIDSTTYCIRRNSKWFYYKINYSEQSTSLSSNGGMGPGNVLLKLNAVVELDKFDIEKAISRFEKLLVLK